MTGDKILIQAKADELGFDLVDLSFDYDKSRDARFLVRCRVCGKVSTKSFVTLVKLGCRCKYCTASRGRWRKQDCDVMDSISNACKLTNHTFLGFQGGKWKNCRETKLLLRCNVCGSEYVKNYDNFVNKHSGCKKCHMSSLREVNVLSESEAEKIARETCDEYGFEFIGFDGDYRNNKTHVVARCLKCGNVISRTFNAFINKQWVCCPSCERSSLEKMVESELSRLGIEYVPQKRFPWLVFKAEMSLDFYLPSRNVAIECQGLQHRKPIDFFGGEEAFKYQLARDEAKRRLCEEHGVRILYIEKKNDIDNAIVPMA